MIREPPRGPGICHLSLHSLSRLSCPLPHTPTHFWVSKSIREETVLCLLMNFAGFILLLLFSTDAQNLLELRG